MNRVLTAEIWREVKKRARTVKSRKAAIAYVTKDLIGLRAGDVLITDASERAIRSGQTSAPLLRELHRNRVEIYSHKGLHSDGSYAAGIRAWGSESSTRYCIGCLTGVSVLCKPFPKD